MYIIIIRTFTISRRNRSLHLRMIRASDRPITIDRTYRSQIICCILCLVALTYNLRPCYIKLIPVQQQLRRSIHDLDLIFHFDSVQTNSIIDILSIHVLLVLALME